MKLHVSLACCLLAAAMQCQSAMAQLAASSPTKASRSPIALAVDAAWQRAAESRAAEGKRELAVANQGAADYFWAAPPSLELSRRDDRGSGSIGARESEAGLTIPLLLPGQRSARRSLAASEHSVAESTLATVRLRIAGEVREAAWDIVARQAEADIADALAANLAALADDVDKRIAAGDLARADGLAARAEVFAASGIASEARQRWQAAVSHWRILTGMAPLADPSETREATVSAGHPELALASAATLTAGKQLELTRASRRDPPELTLRFRQDSPGAGLPSQNSVGVGIRIPFGTSDRNQPREVSARSEFDVARAAEQRLRERLDSEAAVARSALDAAERQARIEKSRVDLLQERATLIEKSFRAGETALPDLLRATLAAAQAQAAFARQQATVGLAIARLKQSIGVLP